MAAGWTFFLFNFLFYFVAFPPLCLFSSHEFIKWIFGLVSFTRDKCFEFNFRFKWTKMHWERCPLLFLYMRV